MKKIIYYLLILSFVSCKKSAPVILQDQTLLYKACHYLWEQQSEDGAWHSSTHGILKGGEAYTPFILWTLMEVPNDVYPKPVLKMEQALIFIRSHINELGFMGISDPAVVEYPNYATSYALRVLSKYGAKKDQVLVDKMQRYLLKQQFTVQRDFNKKDKAYGAWGFGETNLKAGRTGHVDLSHTRRILQALNQVCLNKKYQVKSRYFLGGVQNHPDFVEEWIPDNVVSHVPYDGGFIASTVTVLTNKGRTSSLIAYDSLHFHSYATATCDGLLGLLAAGYSKEEEPVQKAFQWLLEHPELKHPEGIPHDHPNQWHLVMTFYHLAVRAEAYHAMNHEGNWQQKMLQLLQEKQQKDGSFFNPYGAANKEDDPLLATAFAIIAAKNLR